MLFEHVELEDIQSGVAVSAQTRQIGKSGTWQMPPHKLCTKHQTPINAVCKTTYLCACQLHLGQQNTLLDPIDPLSVV